MIRAVLDQLLEALNAGDAEQMRSMLSEHPMPFISAPTPSGPSG
jgi:hypothetical protein